MIGGKESSKKERERKYLKEKMGKKEEVGVRGTERVVT